MNRGWHAFLQAILFVFLLSIGHAASAETSQLTWEYWQPNSPSFAAEAEKTIRSLNISVQTPFHIYSQRFFVSRIIVTGPSLISSTCMSAPKTPVLVGTSCASS